MDNITLSSEQEFLLKVMEETKQHLFITGRAGAGKSVLLRHFRENTKKRVVVAAPTGIAALNVRGQTIHSLFRIAPGLHRKGNLAPNNRICSLLRRIDTLVIDEISMVRADLLDAIDERFREAYDNDLPFGGVQVIMFGDVYQLPPVVEENLMPYFEHVHGGYFFFNALVWKQTEFKIYELTQVFRQKDPVFKDILNAVRDGSYTSSQIQQLNARHGVPIPAEGTVTLAPTNNLVTSINQKRLASLPGTSRIYRATVTGEMKKSVFPTEEILELKKDAQIVMLKNDKDKRWVNGTVGKIEELFDDHIDVNINGVVYTLERETWEEVSYTYDHEKQKIEEKIQSSFTQYPLRLAWALTIHKSQGQTYDSIAIDLTTGTFAPGQMYVALSRATRLEGLYLKMPVKMAHIIVDQKVSAFMAGAEKIIVEATVEEVTQEEPEQPTAELVENKPKSKRGRPKGINRVREQYSLDPKSTEKLAAAAKYLQTDKSKLLDRIIEESPLLRAILAEMEGKEPEPEPDGPGGGKPASHEEPEAEESAQAQEVWLEMPPRSSTNLVMTVIHGGRGQMPPIHLEEEPISPEEQEAIDAYQKRYSSCWTCNRIFKNSEIDEESDVAPCGHAITGLFDITKGYEPTEAELAWQRIQSQEKRPDPRLSAKPSGLAK